MADKCLDGRCSNSKMETETCFLKQNKAKQQHARNTQPASGRVEQGQIGMRRPKMEYVKTSMKHVNGKRAERVYAGARKNGANTNSGEQPKTIK